MGATSREAGPARSEAACTPPRTWGLLLTCQGPVRRVPVLLRWLALVAAWWTRRTSDLALLRVTLRRSKCCVAHMFRVPLTWIDFDLSRHSGYCSCRSGSFKRTGKEVTSTVWNDAGPVM